ncbi:DUF1254 domain-containing protein [Acetobacterium paludosum]|uniref:DUF1254 domain-containing protein n=1 Tax=Acetobacterium paludosum TaxID=52693 RepID=A0A923HUN9_9FIRM|nr:DUF1254 domain-containing protein [Acetobacterium paludosum]MBC3887575.1 DUF1254 domain-containing protein [Acetobacterium paludosum]
MKKTITLILALCLLSTALSGCTEKTTSTTAETDGWQTVSDAYVYCLPLVLVNATMEAMTNTVEPSDTRAPINQLIHAKGLATAASKDIVTPNVDTVYSQAFLDLTDTAMVYVKPKTNRFCSVEVMDAYTNAVSILGSGGDTQDQQTYLFTGPNYKGTVPDNMKQVSLPTNLSWILIRTVCNGDADLDNVYAIQNQMQLLPLDAYLSGEPYTPPTGTDNPKNDFVPITAVDAMTPQAFFDTANQLLVNNPPTTADAPLMKALSSINVGPGCTFDVSVLGDNASEKWKTMVTNLTGVLATDCSKFSVALGSWSYFGEPIAKFGTEYEFRALIAINGIAVNPASVAIYPKAYKDSNGETLNGSNAYTIHFDKNALPPTQENGFWSITAYNSDNFLIDNELNRYCINDRSGFALNEDGSLDILVQTNAPDASKLSNWLPVSSDDFHLYLRIYLPQESVLNGQWSAPVIKKVV